MVESRSIAVAQTCPVKGGIGANVDEHLRLARAAAMEGARLVAFPELSLTGYELDTVRDQSFSEADPRLVPLSELAVSLAITLIAGAPVRIGQNLYIGAFIMQPDSSIGLYTKHHLGAFPESAARYGAVPPAEAAIFVSGDWNPLVECGGYAAAVAVCADIGQPSHPREAAQRGASVYLAGMFVIPSEFERDAGRLKKYATEHAMVVGLSNFGGASGGLLAAGRSSIWSDTGELLVRLQAEGIGIAIATETGQGWRTKAIMIT